MRINTNKGWRLTHKYLPERESPRGESGLHRRSPDLTPELQRAVWADEVVVAAQELEMVFELVLRARMGERSRAGTSTVLPLVARRCFRYQVLVKRA